MANSLLQELQNKLQAYQYTPKTDEEIRAQAAGEYKSYYDQLRLAAQQQNAASDLVLKQRKESLQATYDDQRKQSAKEYADAYSSADRLALSRGMQRSSYNNQTLANISIQGAEAQQAIDKQQAAAEADIDAQRTQLAQQLAQQLLQYNASEAADVLARIRELDDQEYERGLTATEYKNSLASQIYQYMYQAQRDQIADQQWQQQMDYQAQRDQIANQQWQQQMDYQAQRDQIADQQWQQQFDESVRQYNDSHQKSSSGSSGGGGGGGGGGSSDDTTDPTTDFPGISWDQFMSSLGGNQSTSPLGGIIGSVVGAAGTIAGMLGASMSSATKKKTTTKYYPEKIKTVSIE